MKRFLQELLLFITPFCLMLFSSCKQDSVSNDSLSAEDYANISSSLGATVDDVTAASGQVKGISGKTDSWQALCGVATVDTGTGHKILITYDGTTRCQGIIRSGQVIISPASLLHWRQANSVIAITYVNLTFTNSNTGAYYILNGTDTITNETGGLSWKIMAGIDQNTTVRHRQQSTSLNITYTNGTQRIWGHDQTKIYSSFVNGAQNIITLTVFSENAEHLEAWGKTNAGDYFTNAIIDSIKGNNYSTSCLWRPYTGEEILKISNRSADILFGVDNNGNPVGNSTTCPYGYKITYSKGQKILTETIGYIF